MVYCSKTTSPENSHRARKEGKNEVEAEAEGEEDGEGTA